MREKHFLVCFSRAYTINSSDVHDDIMYVCVTVEHNTKIRMLGKGNAYDCSSDSGDNYGYYYYEIVFD